MFSVSFKSILTLELILFMQMECVNRNVGHLCTKDERQPRAKRVKTDLQDSDKTKT